MMSLSRLFTRAELLLVAVTNFALAQDTQIGGFVGAGRMEKHNWNSANYLVAGGEACLRCGGRYGLFLEFNHWERRGIGTGNVPALSLDIGGAGLRIQGKGGQVRPFLDIGLAVGRKRRDSLILPGNQDSVGMAGGGPGFGVAVSVGRHWYVRPFGRLLLLSTNELAFFGGASVGYRF